MWRSRRPKGRSSSCQSELRWNRIGVEAVMRHRSGEASKHQRGRATFRRTKQRKRRSCAASRGNNTKNETKLARFWGTRQEIPTRRWLALHDRDWPRFRDRSHRQGWHHRRPRQARSTICFKEPQNAELTRPRLQIDGLTILVLDITQLRGKSRQLRGLMDDLRKDYRQLVFGPTR